MGVCVVLSLLKCVSPWGIPACFYPPSQLRLFSQWKLGVEALSASITGMIMIEQRLQESTNDCYEAICITSEETSTDKESAVITWSESLALSWVQINFSFDDFIGLL